MESNLAVCLDIELPDGRHRYGFSNGHIRDAQNVWGIGKERREGADPRAGVRASERNKEMFRNLLVRAFHKAWVSDQGEPEPAACQKALNAMLD
jgi:hypothetical protein